jgi:transposase
VPSLVEARELIAEFHAMIRKKVGSSLEPWLERAQASPVAAFARGVHKDFTAVRAVIVSPWSNDKPRARSPSSSSSNVRCTPEQSSTSSKPG